MNCIVMRYSDSVSDFKQGNGSNICVYEQKECSMSDQEELFDYEGRLVFNDISKADLTDPDKLFERLPEYREGSPSEPGEGFIKLNMKKVEARPYLGPDLDQSLGDRIAFRYKKEIYSEEEVVKPNGEIENAFSRSLKTADIFWVRPGYLIYRGRKEAVDDLRSVVGDLLETGEAVSPIALDHDFLIWILYMHEQNKVFSSDLRIDRLTDVKIIGSSDDFGTTSRISGSSEIVRNSTLIESILQGDQIETLGGYFIHNNIILSADISTKGRVHVKTKAELQQATPFERVLISLLFIREVLNTYEIWQQMDNEDKYPPESFFKHIYQRLHSQDVESEPPIDSVVEKYAEKRSEE